MKLPEELDGKRLYYKNEPEYDRVLFLVLGQLLLWLWNFQKTARQREEQKKRNRELLFDYSDIVSGLCVLSECRAAGQESLGAAGRGIPRRA